MTQNPNRPKVVTPNNNMAKNKAKNILAGALAGAALGVAAGLLLAPKSGKGLRRDIKSSVADFYKYAAPQLKKLKNVSKEQYEAFALKAVKNYAKAKRLSATEEKALLKQAKGTWSHLKRHF